MSEPLKLRDFQVEGINFLVERRKALLADTMGAGKTAQSIHAIEKLGAYPCIVVCPASVKINWMREFDMWAPHRKVEVIHGRSGEIKGGADVYVLNYDIVKDRLPQLRMLRAQGIIFDEAHYLKNKSAQRSKACRMLASTMPVRFGLTGTPLLNKPQELIHQLQVLGVESKFGKEWDFLKRYCDAKKVWAGRRQVWDFSGSSNLPELRRKLFVDGPIAIRRTKADVLPELPPTSVIGLPVDISTRREYEEAEQAVFAALIERGLMGKESGIGEGRKKISALIEKGGIGELAKVRKTLALGKVDIAIKWIKDFLEGGDEKLVVFAWHRDVISKLMDKFGDVAVKLQGGDSEQAKQRAVDRFQNDDSVRLFFGNIQAAGVGITLTAASKALFLEVAWSPALLEQAEDRIHRIGQDAEHVDIYYMIGVNTVEEDLLDILKTKKKVVDSVIGER